MCTRESSPGKPRHASNRESRVVQAVYAGRCSRGHRRPCGLCDPLQSRGCPCRFTACGRASCPAAPAGPYRRRGAIHPRARPIHGDVQRSAMRMSLGQIFYLTKDLGLGRARDPGQGRARGLPGGGDPAARPGAADVPAQRPRGVPLGGPTVPGVRRRIAEDVHRRAGRPHAGRLSEGPGSKRQDKGSRRQVLAARVPASLNLGSAPYMTNPVRSALRPEDW